MTAMVSGAIVVAGFCLASGVGLLLVVALFRISGRQLPGPDRTRTGQRDG
jgi:hypothetical protein